MPKTTLEFSGGLHAPLAKTLELSNPSKKPITYAVRLEGAPCFRLPADSVRIESPNPSPNPNPNPHPHKVNGTNKRLSYSVLVVVGNGKGSAGLGTP